MLKSDFHRTNLERVYKKMGEKFPKWEAVLVPAGCDLWYLTGFSGSTGWLVLTPDSQKMILDGRYWDQFSQETSGIELVRYESPRYKSFLDCLEKLLKEVSIRTLFLLEGHWSLAEWRTFQKSELTFRVTSKIFEELRIGKSEFELNALKEAAKLADKALAKALEHFEEGIQESQWAAILEFECKKLGASSLSFDTIVASGPNGSKPHAGVSERKIKKGELVTIDFGVCYQNYVSDMTRTVWLGDLPAEQKLCLKEVQEARKRAIGALKLEMTATELDAVARDHLKEKELDRYFVHSLGHGIGLEVHEQPGIRSTSTHALGYNEVITIEPGVYLPGKYGCRVEDCVYIEKGSKEDQVVQITHSPYQEFGHLHPLDAYEN